MFDKKTAWLESQYLFPHHFQQQERYLEGRVEKRCAAIAGNVWGFDTLELDSAALAEGQLAVAAARGVMPDGTPFQLPEDGPLPPPIRMASGARDRHVYLVLPRYQPGVRYLDTADAPRDSGRVARYRLRSTDVFDYTGESTVPEAVETAVLNFSLAVEDDERGGHTQLPLARVREVTPEGAVVLDPGFVPPSLWVSADRRLSAYLDDVIGMLQQRGEALAGRFNDGGRSGGGSSAIADFLLLQLVNRHEPRLRHLAGLTRVHPERLFAELAGLAGELATFTTDAKRPVALPVYRHDDLSGSFGPLMEALEGELSAVLEQTAVALPVEERQYGIRVARVGDRSLLGQARFVLAAKADLPTESLRERFPGQIKAGSVESIRNLVNNQLPGIGLNPLPVAPREIPYHAGCVYFELDSGSERWNELKRSGGFAFHVAGDLPGLKLELWAIRD